MAVGVLVKTVVFDQSLYVRGGMANRWLAGMTAQFGQFARQAAPEREGTLRAGISTETHQLSVRLIQGTIESSAPHTMYVLRGTTGPIRTRKGWANGIGEGRSFVMLWRDDPKTGRRKRMPVRIKGYWMALPPWGEFGKVFADEVSGQAAQNFMATAWKLTARNHKSLRGRIPQSILNP